MPKKIDNQPTVRHIGQVHQVAETSHFVKWFDALRDQRAVAKILDRIKRASDGNFGDVKSAGSGISEMRIDYGPGYRVYFVLRGKELVLLLCGGDKRTQDVDIAFAKRLKAEIERSDGPPPL